MTVNNSETPAASIGQFLVIAGLIILYGFGSFWVCAELIKGGEDKDKIPMYIQYGVPVLFAGIGVLFFTVLFQRLKAAKTDKYKDVQI
jgi:TRAP-type C4-dicarboxylate transport system permease small subunit|tara:strand:- start:304 stop:567 length:264 start_codon:yes stop_codon:yes gene_type:complete